MKKAMLTGHRPGKHYNEEAAEAAMQTLLEHYRPDRVITGGADGADRSWARVAYKNGIPYELFVPRGYYSHYHKDEQWPHVLIENAVEVHPTQAAGLAFHWKYNFQRNEQMVAAADIHIACCKSPIVKAMAQKGGTSHCIGKIIDAGVIPVRINSLTGEIEWESYIGF